LLQAGTPATAGLVFIISPKGINVYSKNAPP